MHPEKNRIIPLDALRGFALLGILIVNIFVFHAPYIHYEAFYRQFTGFEADIIENMIFFLGGKFMPIFAFLFGYGFWLQYSKAKNILVFKSYWNRRMLILIGFGVFHVLIFSFGDILIPYALLGLILPFIAKNSNTFILIMILLTQLIPLIGFVFSTYYGYNLGTRSTTLSLEEIIALRQNGSFLSIMMLRLKEYFSMYNEKVFYYIPKEWSCFLIGVLASRKNLALKLKTKAALTFCIPALLFVLCWYSFNEELRTFFTTDKTLLMSLAFFIFITLTVFIHPILYIIGFFLFMEDKNIQLVAIPSSARRENVINKLHHAICNLCYALLELWRAALRST